MRYLSRNLFCLVIAQASLKIGKGFLTLCLSWFVLESTGSILKTGMIAALTGLAASLGAFLGGPVIDRIGLVRASKICDFLSGCFIAAIPICYAFGYSSYEVLAVLVLFGWLLDGPGTLAKEALFPPVSEESGVPLARINTLFEVFDGISILIGPVLAGFCIQRFGAVQSLWFYPWFSLISIASLFLLNACYLYLPVNLPSNKSEGREGGYVSDLNAGLRSSLSDPLLRSVICFGFFTAVFLSPLDSVLLPVLARSRQLGPDGLSYLVGSFGVGALVATVIFWKYHTAFTSQTWLTIALIGVSLSFLGLAPNSGVAMMRYSSGCVGFFAAVLVPVLSTLLQRTAPIEMRTRILGVFSSLMFIACPIGDLWGAFLLHHYGEHWVFPILSLGLLASGIFLPNLALENQRLQVMRTAMPKIQL